MDTRLRIAVIGAGAVGGLFGAMLARAGHQVVFLARGDTLRILRDSGLVISGVSGDFSINPVEAENNAAEIGVVDLVLVCVKSWQVRALAPSLAPLVGAGTIVIPLQNGVEAPDHLANALPSDAVMGGACKVICKATDPCVIEHVGVPPIISFGSPGDAPAPKSAPLIEAALCDAGLDTTYWDNIDVPVWEKLVLINGMSGLGAITRSPIGAILSSPGARQMLEQVMRETYEVGRASGVALEPDTVDRILAFYEGLPPEGTSSMQRDIMDGRPSELEELNGAVCRIGERLGIETPVNRMIYSSLVPQELRSRRTAR